VNVVAERAFRDHHAYLGADIQELQRIRESSGAAGFVTTGKDEINLGEFASKLSPLSVAGLNVSVDQPEELMAIIEKVAGGAKAAKS
jgi:tetraacyldisaccharide-1-P 4'-kinase